MDESLVFFLSVIGVVAVLVLVLWWQNRKPLPLVHRTYPERPFDYPIKGLDYPGDEDAR